MAQARRRVLSLAISATCHEAGFSSADESAIELLTVMLQSLITEISRESQLLAEHNGRSEVVPRDVYLSLIDLGLNVESIIEYGKRRNFIRIPPPNREVAQKQPALLQAGHSKPLYSYIPDHFPPFPDPHTYIRTTTHKQPMSEYEAIRDKAASQKRDLERALTRFVAKVCQPDQNHCLFGQNANLNKYFPLISIKPSALPFMDALLPKDQIFDDDEDEDDDRTDQDKGKRVKSSD